MSHNSRKRKLLNDLKRDCQFGIVMNRDNKRENEEIDRFVEEIELIFSHRYLVPRVKLFKSDHWSSSILPNLDDNRFRAQLRVTREQFQLLMSEISHHPLFRCKTNKQVPVEKQLAVFLFRVGHNGNGSSFCNIGQKFCISDGGTIVNVTRRVIQVLLSLKEKFIYWPDLEERDKMEELLSDELPGCIGFVDGTLIPLEEKPSVEFPDDYYSRKQRYSLHLQIVCDYNLKIRHYKIGRPGSVHDAKVFADCVLSKYPRRFFSPGQFLGADAAYKLTENCITPFRKNSTFRTAAERRKFNRHVSKHRVKVEHSFGILKEKFCSLKELRLKIWNNDTHTLACQWVEACCVLFNITLNKDDIQYYNLLNYGEIVETDPVDFDTDNGEERRTRLFNYIMLNC